MKHSPNFAFLLIFLLFVLTTDTLAQISSIEPSQPRWGKTLTIIYNTAAAGAKFSANDEIYVAARMTFPGFGENFSAKMIREGALFKYRLILRSNLSYLNFHFITLNGGWDEGAYTTTMVYRDDGQPARGAYESKINSGKYQEFFKLETELYGDNFSAYRAKWSMALTVDFEKATRMINSDIRKLSGMRSETAELLSALSYGHLLLNREDKCRELIRLLFTRYPDSNYTALAIGDYESEVANRGVAGEGQAEISRIKLEIIRNYPGTEFARNASTVMAKDQRAPLDVIETITRHWMKDEPENPQPYYNLAQAYKNQYQKYEQAIPLIEKAINLLLEGKMHLYGDINGRQTASMLSAAYLSSADLQFRQNKTDKAISAVRVAESFEQDPPYSAYLLEARIWQSLAEETKAENAYIEAWRRGSQEAEERLKTRYKNRRGGLQGFDEYLLNAGHKNAANGPEAMTKRPSPQFRITSIDGKTFDLDQMQGKVVVLNLWFIACGPCRKEIPKLNQLVSEFRDKNVVFIAASLDTVDSLRSFLKTMPFDYNIVANAEEFVVSKFNAVSFPTHIVIDQDGQIEMMLVGGGERRPEEVRRVLLRLLNIQTSQQ
jgi:peroxiredoxin